VAIRLGYKKMKRRKFSKAIAGLAGLTTLTGLYSWQVEPFRLEFVNKRMPVKNLPHQLQGLTLMQISDMHVGNRFDPAYLIKSFEKAREYTPDFVVYTGDYVSYEDSRQVKQLQVVLKSAVKGKLGTVGILGNHDYGKNWAQDQVADTITQAVRDAGIEVLRNEEVTINGLTFVGLDDYWATNFQPRKVMDGYDSQKASIVLCHNPDVCDLDIWNGYQGWILAGHTHGGQCKPPFLPPPLLPVKNKKYSAGEVDLKDGRTLYINRALGHLWQVRFNVRPEITLFQLHNA
jgi:predicted MPP superfamily phosphohydrolase